MLSKKKEEMMLKIKCLRFSFHLVDRGPQVVAQQETTSESRVSMLECDVS